MRFHRPSLPAALFPLACLGSVLSCSDGGGPNEPSATGERCPKYSDASTVEADRCARIVGTVRDQDGNALAGAVVKAISAGAFLDAVGPVQADARGRYELEVLARFHDNLAALDTVSAYLRAHVDLGEAAADTSVLVDLVLAIEGTRPPLRTVDLVIDRSDTPRPTGRIVFVRDPDLNTGDLYLINADGSGRQALVVDQTYNLRPAWTPDGGAILFAPDGRLTLIDPDGGNRRPFGIDLSGFYPRWAPDGRHVAWLAPFTDERGGSHTGVWVASADGTDPRRLPTRDDVLCIRTCSSIEVDRPFGWYPDSDRIGYEVTTFGTGGSVVGGPFTTRLSDSTTERIDGPVPIWARDGSRYATVDRNLLRILSPTGTQLAAVPLGSTSTPQAAWSPDGEWIAYTLMETGLQWQLWIADRDGNRRRRIALDASDPDWRPTP